MRPAMLKHHSSREARAGSIATRFWRHEGDEKCVYCLPVPLPAGRCATLVLHRSLMASTGWGPHAPASNRNPPQQVTARKALG